MSPRENRYRRLLALYPADFRREYAEEMLGVLMADPRPARGHVVNLLAGAVAAHFRPTLGGPAWRHASSAVYLFGAIMLCAVSARRLVALRAAAPAGPSFTLGLDDVDVVRAAAWAVVVVAALVGLRWLGVTAALVGLGGEIAAPFRLYADTPATFLDDYWIVLTAAVVLVAAVFARPGPRPRGWLLVTAAGVVLAASGIDMLSSYQISAAVAGHGASPSPGAFFSIAALLLLAAALLGAAGVFRLAPEVRRWVIACAVPVLGAFPLVGYGFAGFEEFNMRHPESTRLLDPAQWAALIVIPVLAFWVAAWLTVSVSVGRVPEK